MDTAQLPQEETTVNETDPQASVNRLVLPSLEIKNFRAFRHLTIEKLGRVNLITGKNNVGKTSLLEALWLYAEAAHPFSIREILSERSELNRSYSLLTDNNDEFVLDGTSLFYGRATTGLKKYSFSIGSKFDIAMNPDEVGNQIVVSYITGDPYSEQKDRIDAIVFGVEHTYSFDVINREYGALRRPSILRDLVISNLFLKTRRVDSDRLATLWDKIVLLSGEARAIRALQIVDGEVQKVAFVAGENNSRVPIVKRRSEKHPLPLDSYGEGFIRLLAIALSLAYTSNGILLIDEIENGLHYSVLPDVWRLIFQTARRLNVQVFATTHSWDCIEAFQQAASEDDDPSSGVLVRLQNDNGNVTSTVFDERRLAIVTRDGIEVR